MIHYSHNNPVLQPKAHVNELEEAVVCIKEQFNYVKLFYMAHKNVYIT